MKQDCDRHGEQESVLRDGKAACPLCLTEAATSRQEITQLLQQGERVRAAALLGRLDLLHARLTGGGREAVTALGQELDAARRKTGNKLLPEAWSTFLHEQGEVLARGGLATLLQAALAEAEGSPVARAAESWLEQQGSPVPFLRRLDRPRRSGGADRELCLRTIGGHARGPLGLALLPGDDKLLTLDTAGLVRLWDPQRGDLLQVFKVRPTETPWLVVLPDGRRLLAARARGEQDPPQPEPVGTEDEEEPCPLVIVPDGDRGLKIWDIEREARVALLPGGAGQPSAAVLDAGGLHLLTLAGGLSGAVQRWDLAAQSGAPCRVRRTHLRSLPSPATGVRRAVALSGDGEALELYDLDRGELLEPLRPHAPGNSASWMACTLHPDGRTVVSATAAGEIVFTDLVTRAGRQVRQATGDADSSARLSWLAVDADGRRAVTFGSDHRLEVVNLETGELLRGLALPGLDGSRPGQLHPDRQRLVLAEEQGPVTVLDLETGLCCATLTGHEGQVGTLLFQDEGRRLWTAGPDGTVRLWNLEAARPAARPARHPGRVAQLRATERGFVSVCREELQLRDARTGRCLARQTFVPPVDWEGQRLHRWHVRAIEPSGRRVALEHSDGSCWIWDIDSGVKQVRLQDTGRSGVQQLVFHPDGQRLVGVTGQGELALWELASGARQAVIARDASGVEQLLVDPEGRAAHGLTGDGVRSWLLDGGGFFLTPLRRSSDTTVFLVDGGRHLVTARPGELELLRTDDGTRVARLLEPEPGEAAAAAVRAVDLDVRRGWLLSVRTDGQVQLRDLRSGAELASWWGTPATTCAIGPNGPLALGDETGQVAVFELCTGHGEPWQRVEAVGAPAEQDGQALLATLLAAGRAGEAGALLGSFGALHERLSTTGPAGVPRLLEQLALVLAGAPSPELASWTGLLRRHACALQREGAAALERAALAERPGSPLRAEAEAWLAAHPQRRRSLLRRISGPPDPGSAAPLLVLDPSAGSPGERPLVAFHPRAPLALALSRDGVLGRWDLRTGALLGRFGTDARAEPGTWLAWSADGQRAILARVGSLAVWDLQSGCCVRSWRDLVVLVKALAVHPDGRRLLVATHDAPYLSLIDLEQGRRVRSFAPQPARVTALALHPDGRLAASADQERTVRLWDVETGQLLGTLDGPWEYEVQLAFSPGAGPVAAHDSRTLRFFDPHTCAGLGAVETGGEAGSLAFTASGRDLLLAAGPWLQQRAGRSGALVRRLGPLPSPAAALGCFVEDTRAAVACSGGVIAVWEPAGSGAGDGPDTASAEEAAPDRLWSVGFSPDDQLALSLGRDGVATLWRCATGERIAALPQVGEALFTPEGQVLAGLVDGTLLRWDPASGRTAPLAEALAGSPSALCLLPGGDRLLAGGEDGELGLWDLSSGRRILQLAGHEARVTALAVDATGHHALSAGWDSRICLWELGHAAPVASWEQPGTGMPRLAFDEAGRAVWDNGWDALRLFDPLSGALLLERERAATGPWVLDRPGRRAVGNDEAGCLSVFELPEGRLLRRFGGEERGLDHVLLSADGRLAVGVSPAGRLPVWDTASGELLATWCAGSPLSGCAVSEHGRIACGDAAGRLTVLQVEPGWSAR